MLWSTCGVEKDASGLLEAAWDCIKWWRCVFLFFSQLSVGSNMMESQSFPHASFSTFLLTLSSSHLFL